MEQVNIIPFYKSAERDNTLLKGNCIDLLRQFNFKFDMIFADPPYFLSNGGISLKSGKIVSVDKGIWDKAPSKQYIDDFNSSWLRVCKEKLKDNGTIWVCGTFHNIFSIAKNLSLLNFKLLNIITWAKTNPPDNISKRVFTHSAEFIIWAKKTASAHHKYNYELMRKLNNNRQMSDVWYLSSVQKWEKSCGKHPTQKPLPLMARIILASTDKKDWILDPFCGSGTTGIAANLLDRRFLGIEQNIDFLNLSVKRRIELDNEEIKLAYQEKVLSECHNSITFNSSRKVLIGRIGSIEQWNWFLSSNQYNLPISKILSMPQILSVEYVLILYESHKPTLLKISKLKPQIRTREQISATSNQQYNPRRDHSYWVIHLIHDDIELSIYNKKFERNLLINRQQERGAYWIRSLEEVLGAFH